MACHFACRAKVQFKSAEGYFEDNALTKSEWVRQKGARGQTGDATVPTGQE